MARNPIEILAELGFPDPLADFPDFRVLFGEQPEEILNRMEQERVRDARLQLALGNHNRLTAQRRNAGGRPGGNEVVGGGNEDLVEGRTKIEIPLAEKLEKIITQEAYRELLAKCQSSEGAAAGSGNGDGVTYLFQDLQLKGLQDKKGNVEDDTLKESILTLESYLNGKKKGKDKIKSAFSLIPGEVEEARARYYFLKLDSNLLEKLARTLGEDAMIKATLKIKRASGSDNSSGASTSASSGCRSSNLEHPRPHRHDPNTRTELRSERGDEMVYLSEPEGGVLGQGKVVSELLDPSSRGVKLVSAPNSFVDFILALDKFGILKRYKLSEENSCPGIVHFFLNVRIESTNMAKQIEKVQLGAQQILQDMYELEDSCKEVTIVASNGAEVKCHRVILMAQIPSFHTMLSPERGMNEAQTGRIELNENSEDGLREFIRFLYGFEVNLEGITSDMALELFQLGNKYQVKKLDDAMKNFLCEKKIDFYKVDTILELYFIVRNVDCLEELRTHALTEMSKLSKEVLKGSDYFKSLCYEDQVDLLFVLFEWNK